jgi:hypothetical protein
MRCLGQQIDRATARQCAAAHRTLPVRLLMSDFAGGMHYA